MTRREMLQQMAVLAVSGMTVQERAVAQAGGKAYSFVNGRWFDGKQFSSQSFYAVNEMLTHKKPAIVDEVIDLQQGYVVPPYGDAHCHHFDGPFNVEQQIQMYLRDGIFYVKVLTNSLSGARAVAGRVNRPDSVDVVYAQGGLTGDNSHPIPVYEALGLGYYTPQDQQTHQAEILKSRRRENDCYYIIDTRADLDRRWPLILAGRPDFIKVYLLHSEDYEKRKREKGYGGGIDPKLLPEIVARALRAGLTVSAHVDSAADYHTALTAGVDEMAHLPGYYVEAFEDVRTYQLSPADVAETGRRGVRVVPTASLAGFMSDPKDRDRTRANQIRNLTLLKAAGVRFGIGADSYGTDSLREALYLSKLGVWSNLEMLKMWCEDAPRAAFPHRKIGRLAEEYEASFLVLRADPLENFDHVQDISLRFKQGGLISMTEEKEHPR